MDDHHEERSRKRGPYKEYYRDVNIKIPESTLRSKRIHRALEALPNEDAIDDNTKGSVTSQSCSLYEQNDFIEVANINISDEQQMELDPISESDDEAVDEMELDYFNETDYYNYMNEVPIDSDSDGGSDASFYHENFEYSEPENNVNQEYVAIYDGCDLSKEESEILMLAYSLRHNLPDNGLDNLLSLINCHLPGNTHISMYMFLKSFPTQKFIEYCYCPDCSTILEFDNDTGICKHCLQQYKKAELKKRGHFFIHIPLKEQLINLINSNLYSRSASGNLNEFSMNS